MVHHHHRCHQAQKEEDPTSHTVLVVDFGNASYKRTRPKLIRLLFFFCLFSCSLVFAPRLFNSYSSLPFFYSLETQSLQENGVFLASEEKRNAPICSSISHGEICCDRSGFRSDVCFMKGDVRTHSPTSSIFLYSSSNNATMNSQEESEEKIERVKPYTRKWETSIMDTIDELRLISRNGNEGDDLHSCQVSHSVPAIFFSTGGYTGNVYHEFNDGILPLYITSKKFNRKVVFVMLEYHNWWITKYGDILSRLSDYPPIDFTHDKTVHCFPEAIVGLRIHNELTVDSSLMPDNQTIQDFRQLLDEAYKPRIRGLIQEEESQAKEPSTKEEERKFEKRPKLVILSRNGSRAIINERDVVGLAEEIGFRVEVLQPTPSTELAKIYRALNSCEVMVGVHGAAMTHFLFMRPGSVFVQVVPLGTEWAAQTYYGDPAMKLGLKYIGYGITPKESTLYGEYKKDDPVLRDPRSVNAKGWQWTKRVYLDGQNVKLDLRRFRKRLVQAYEHSILKRGRWRDRRQQW
ncbi:xylan glycosyltransferase MUCI21 [Magnolia sinica]|uniref:xylan glycosyltransferase MUCI21 n=1 Tax=Magnolia sinica TaxID=86752 RepID=UPI002658D14C|nr:xylan glycosyltransferase MUCI21 [Magnolia sinica]